MEGIGRHETKEMRLLSATIYKNEKSYERGRQADSSPSAGQDHLLLQTLVVPFRDRKYAVLLHPALPH